MDTRLVIEGVPIPPAVEGVGIYAMRAHVLAADPDLPAEAIVSLDAAVAHVETTFPARAATEAAAYDAWLAAQAAPDAPAVSDAPDGEEAP